MITKTHRRRRRSSVEYNCFRFEDGEILRLPTPTTRTEARDLYQHINEFETAPHIERAWMEEQL